MPTAFQVPVSSLPALSGAAGAAPAQTGSASGSQTINPNGAPATGAAGGGNYTAYNNNGSTTTYVNGVPTTTPAVGTMTANISSPNSTQTTNPPAVVTSANAQNDLANKQGQVAQLNTDTTNHQAAIAGSLPQAPTATDASSQTPTGGTDSTSLDSQVGDLLSSFNTKSGSIEDNATTQGNELSTEAQQAQTDLDTQATAATQKLNAIASGVYPLTPAEMGVLNATQNGFQSAMQYQQTANQAYTGQMTEAMASLGINTSAPTQAIGMIYSAISTGNQKVADLNSQMAVSLGNLQVAFQNQDFNEVEKAWNDTASYMENRVNTLNTMQKNVQDAAAQQVTELQSATSTNISSIMGLANFSLTQKQDIINNAFQQQQISETQRHDLATEAIASFTAGIGAGGSGGANNLTPVTTDASGVPNSVQQTQFLSQLPSSIATLVKGIANYTISPTSLSTSKKQAMGGFTQAQIVALAQQYNPNYQEQDYAARAATLKQFQSGTYSQNVTALNTAIGHLTDLAKAKAGLGNVGFTPANFVKNSTEGAFGVGSITKFSTTLAAATGELATTFKNSGATDKEIAALGTINSNSSPEQIKAYVSAASNLLGSRLNALNQTYASSMGQGPQGGTFLSPSSQSALLSLQGQGYDIQVDGLDQTPMGQLATFQSASPQNATILKSLQQAMPDATPDEVIDYLKSNGAI